jgi:hypothetical protein
MKISSDYRALRKIYEGSDGALTQALYAHLSSLGAPGIIAANLFRASKNSHKAKLYRGSPYRGMAYERKAWALQNLTKELMSYAAPLGLQWGWGVDEDSPYFQAVLYLDLPTGQVSLHTKTRLSGPEYLHRWDGEKGLGGVRVCRFVEMVMEGQDVRSKPRKPNEVASSSGSRHLGAGHAGPGQDGAQLSDARPRCDLFGDVTQNDVRGPR